MILELAEMAATTRGIYTVGGVAGRLGSGQRWLEPDAAVAFATMEAATGGWTYSDAFRTASQSLAAHKAKPSITQPPGWSTHNYGLAIDVDVDGTLALYGLTYPDLLRQAESFGWYCYRRDQRRGSEDWHFTWLGSRANTLLAAAESHGWAAAGEGMIQALWGDVLLLDDQGLQVALRSLRLYHGEVDGVVGPETMAAVHAFQRAWSLGEGLPDANTRRVLAYVAASIVRRSVDGSEVVM